MNNTSHIFSTLFLFFITISALAQIDTMSAKIETRRWLEEKKDWMNFTDVYPVIHQSKILYVATQTQQITRIHFEGCQVEMDLQLTRRDYKSLDHYRAQDPKASYLPKEIHLQLDLSQIKALYLKFSQPSQPFLYNEEFVQYLNDTYILYFFELKDNQESEKHLFIGRHVDPELKGEPANRIKEAFDHYIQLCGGYVSRKN